MAKPTYSSDRERIAHMTSGQRVRAVLAASSGNLVEWYDFYIYVAFSTYFESQFFGGDSTSQALNTAAVLLAGFLMRPIGGFIFGKVGDRYGRRTAMMIAIIMMASGSLAFAILPTHQAVGVLAPILMLFVRCVQGISVGGEYGSTATYMSEVATPGRRGFYSSFQYVTLIGGLLLANLTATIMTKFLSEAQLGDGGWWRLPFVIGALGGLISLYLRRNLAETSSESERKEAGAGTFRAVFAHRRAFWTVVAYTSAGSLIFYVVTTVTKTYMITGKHFTKEVATDTITVCLLIYMLLQPVMGTISDKIGRRNCMIIAMGGMVLATVPIMHVVGNSSNLLAVGAMIVLGMVLVSFYTSISGIVKAEMFPASIRTMGVGFCYAIGNAMFGGSAQYVSLWFKSIDQQALFGWYVVFITLFGLTASILMKDNRRDSHMEGDVEHYATVGAR